MHFPDQIDLGHYGRLYPQIAEALGSARKAPSCGELALLAKAAAIELPRGNVGPANLCFLAVVASALGAVRVLEIGTASGTSTALLGGLAASTLAERGARPEGILIDSIDKKKECLFDAAKPVGYMVGTLAPDLAAHVRIHTERDSFLAREIAPRAALDLAFIDGNHQHPWPLIDVLNVLPLMRPGAWLILHDIELPAVAARMGIEARYGAQWLFDGWPERKVASDNIGAVALPPDTRTLRPFFEELAARPFEVAESGWKRYQQMLEGAFAFAFGA